MLTVIDSVWLDAATIATAVAAVVALFITKRTREQISSDAESHSVTEAVDSTVLGQFQELMTRLSALEIELATTNLRLESTERALAAAQTEITELRKLEEYLQARLHEKDAEVRILAERRAALSEQLTQAQSRITHLEEVIHRAGLNGDQPLPCDDE